MGPPAGPAVLRRTEKSWRPLTMAVSDSWPQPDLFTSLVHAGARRLWLVGGWDAQHTPDRAWFTAPVECGVSMSRYTNHPRSARYEHPLFNRVDVGMSATWFGRTSEPWLVRDAFNALQGALRGEFSDRRIALLGTPARTGLDLLERTLPQTRAGVPYEYPPLPAEVADLLRHNYGQGRREFCATGRALNRRYASLSILDGRWMYAACIRHLPVGLVVHDFDVPDFEAHRPGFYRVEFKVPAGWEYPFGLLPCQGDDGRPYWPHYPGLWHTSWCGEPELRLAEEMGWTFRVRERILWPRDSQPGSDPARTWLEHLTALRARAERTAADVGAPCATAIRKLVIDTVGSWYRESRPDYHQTPHEAAATIPATALDLTPVPDLAHVDSWIWYEPARLAPEFAPWQRPEWACYVWSRARARVASAALLYCDQCGPDALLAFRSDALLVTTDPHWPDDGQPGTFRVKHRLASTSAAYQLAAPCDELDYRALLRYTAALESEAD